MSRRRTVIALALLVAGTGPVIASAKPASACRAPAPPPLRFGKPTYIDTNRAGGEPVVLVAKDGSVNVTAHAGTTHIYKDPTALPGAPDFAVGYANETLNWHSVDGGTSWSYVGLAGQSTGPHSLLPTGFSDPDLSMDAGGKLYNAEITYPVNASVYTSDDDGASWAPIANPLAGTGDRPWVTGTNKDEVFLYMNSPKQLWHSVDGGLTFENIFGPHNTGAFPVNGKMVVDPLRPTTGLIGPVTAESIAEGSAGQPTGGVAFSANSGRSWEVFPMPETPKSTAFFSVGAMAVDRAGTVYVATAGGYEGPDDAVLDGLVTLSSFDRTTRRWSAVATIPTPKGDALWPWVVAGDPGRVAVLWLQRPSIEQSFHLYAAQTLNATGSVVKCGKGTMHVGPTFSVTDVAGRSIHDGPICLNGTSCNAETDIQKSDRRLGEFATITVDHQGRLLVASSDTMLRSVTGGPKPVANPLFIGQSSGARLYR